MNKSTRSISFKKHTL